MQKLLKKSSFLSLFLMLLTGCMSKSNGKYQTHYSYHPYYDLYAKKMSKAIPKPTIQTSNKELKTSLATKSRYPN